MSDYKKPVLAFALIAVLCIVLMVSVAYATETVSKTIEAGYTGSLIFNLDDGDKFSGSLSISGGSGNDINFWVTDPSGNTIVNSGRVSQGTSFEFTAQRNGAYTLHLDNGFSVFSSKIVSLSYDVESPILPNPSNSLVWVVAGAIIIGLGLIGLAVYLSLRRRTQPSSTT